MSKEQVRERFEKLPPDVQDYAARRFKGGPVFSWTYLTRDEIASLYGIACAAAVLFEVSP